MVGGAPGSGKSHAFPVRETGVDYFNVDDWCAEFCGSYLIPNEIRELGNLELERFILTRISQKRSFAFETTLRTAVTFQQAKLAREAGFDLFMIYVGVEPAGECLNRVKARVREGGHAIPIDKFYLTYRASLDVSLPRALVSFDAVWIYDNSLRFAVPKLVLQTIDGRLLFVSPDIPMWVIRALVLAFGEKCY